MRLTRVRLRGINTFTRAEPVDVDFDALGPGLVAVTGDNGAGKTTLMEAVPAALYKALPSRDSWYEHFAGRDAFVEATFEDDGHQVQARVQVDAERRLTERYLFVDGASTTTGRGKEADAEVLRRFGSYELYLASIHGAQKRTGNFLDAVKGERKARFAELLGLARLEALAAAAHEERLRAEAGLERARPILADLERQLEAKPTAEAAVKDETFRQEVVAGALADAREEEAAATAALERARTAEERLASRRASVKAADTAFQEASRAVKEAEESEARAHQTAEKRREDLRNLVARRPRLEALVAGLPSYLEARQSLPALEEEQARLEAAEKALAERKAERRVDEETLAGARRRLADEERVVKETTDRLRRQAGLLKEVPCTAQGEWFPKYGLDGEGVELAGTCPLLKDAKAAAATKVTVGAEYREAIDEAEERAEAAEAAVEAATFAVDPLRLAEIKRCMPALRELAAQAQEAERAREDLDTLEVNYATTSKAIEADLADSLDAALARLVEGKIRRGEAERAAKDAGKALQDALAETAGPLSRAEANLSMARQARVDAERALREADRAHAAAEAALKALQALEAGLPGAREAVATVEQDLGDWTLLEKALGKDGIQALEIDAAGPEVARLVNDLLAACATGTRWTVAFETLREKKSSPGEYSEAFDVRVYDHGEERTVEGISGGERVIVGEALALALAIYNARKSGIRWETIFRDETSGALSLANATAYTDMLRRALQLGGFRQVVFISHQPEVVARADVRLVVAGGRVAVEGAPDRVSPAVALTA